MLFYDTVKDRYLAADKVITLLNDSVVDGPVFNQGRVEGNSDVCAELRAILDPQDLCHWNKDGLLKEVRRLKDDRDSIERERRRSLEELADHIQNFSEAVARTIASTIRETKAKP
jgi:hypothetical protein